VKVLLDENTAHKLRGLLPSHEVVTVAYLGWVGIKNGQLLKAAEDAGFEVLITTDQGMAYEQNMVGRKLAVLVLSTPDWNMVKRAAGTIVAALERAIPGEMVYVDCGRFTRRKATPTGPGPS
jgi:hypothetical protein